MNEHSQQPRCGDRSAAPPPPNPVRIDSDGTAHIPMFSVPLSRYMSAAARNTYFRHARMPAELNSQVDVVRYRQLWDEHFYRPRLARARKQFEVRTHSRMLGGVPVDIVEPASGIAPENRDRVLVDLHGGGFTFGAGMGGLLESIPIASMMGIKVVSVDYRQGPEHRFPAASEDVASVYRALLARHEARNIGIYGCSAGGLLSAMTVAWLHRFEIPLPGAIGVLFSPIDDQFDGDSRYLTPPLMGQQPPLPYEVGLGMMAAYLEGTDSGNALVSPLSCPALLAAFPPTLLATGTRAGDFSSVVHSHAELVKAGADARLHVWEGLWHGFTYDTELPESLDLFRVLTRFFNDRLG